MADVVQAGEFATDGERQAAEALRQLPDDWAVICNKMLVTTNGRSFEIDFIVLAHNLVFALDEKSWRGTIQGSDQVWVRGDGSSEQSPLSKIDYVSRVLSGHLRARVGGLRSVADHFVHGGVLLSQAAMRPAIRDPRARDGVFLLDTVVRHLQDIDSRAGSGGLIANWRQEIVAELYDLSNRPKTPKQILDYAITEVMAGRPGARVFQATHPDAGPRTLVVYPIDRADPAPQVFFRREFKALQHLQTTGLVPEVGDPFVWSDDFLVVPIKPLNGRPLSAVRAEDGIQELRLALASFQALAALHAQGVIHRALGPEALIMLRGGAEPRVGFVNFYAARLGDATIAANLDELLQADPYAAPELATGYGFATPESDCFSLALIWLERFSGFPVANLRDERGRVILPASESWPRFSPEVTAALKRVLGGATTLGPLAPLGAAEAQRPSVASLANALDEIMRDLRASEALEKDRLLDDRYQVRRLLGEGASARTFLATDRQAEGLYALKQLRQVATTFEQARREFNLLKDIVCPNLPRVHWINEPHNDVHLILEYIEGPTLKELAATFPWSIDRWQRLMHGLFTAVLLLEAKGLLHRDIKPANIIVRDETDEPVLIDFGFAVRAGSAWATAGTPLYLPPEAILAEQPPATCDQYALGVVLFQALTGRLPFEESDASAGQARLLAPEMIADERQRALARVLLQAVAPDPARRFGSVRVMYDAIRAAFAQPVAPPLPLPPLVNPWVDRVRGLYRHSASGNADNRGLDTDFARRTYVPTRLDEELLPAILKERPAAVFLSGNPGDGKTAFLEQVRAALLEQGASERDADVSGWHIDLEGHHFQSCYDASEAHAGLSADEQLGRKLAGLAGAVEPADPLTVLVAINDGRLDDFFQREHERFRWLARQIERTRRRGRRSADRVWLIDLKRRSFVTLAPGRHQPSVFQRVLDRLVEPAEWRICDGCGARTVCPIRRNAAALRGTPDDDRVRTQLERLFLLAHLRGQRHTTMRDLRSALAYLITGNLACQDIHAARAGQTPLSLAAHAYWRLIFSASAQSEDSLADLATLDPGRLPRPALDRFLFFARNAADAPRRGGLFADGEDLAPEQFETVTVWLGATKQRLLFEGADDPPVDTGRPDLPVIEWHRLLPHHHFRDFLNALRGRTDLGTGRHGLLWRLAQGISASDGITGEAATKSLCVRVAHSDEQRLTVLKQFPLDQFRLAVVPPAVEHVEGIPSVLRLEHIDGTPRLEIALDLFELLLRLADGLRPTAPEHRPLLEDLAPFKSALLLRDAKNLVLVESNRRIHHITQRDGKIVRLTAGE